MDVGGQHLHVRDSIMSEPSFKQLLNTPLSR